MADRGDGRDSLPKMDSVHQNGPSELSQAVEDMLNNITTKFSAVSAELMAKMDDMARRLDTLESVIQANASKGESSK